MKSASSLGVGLVFCLCWIDGMNEFQNHVRQVTRRHLFQQVGTGIGALALTTLLQQSGFGSQLPSMNGEADNPLTPRQPHFPARAKNVIYIHLVGAPSHLDLYDYKPELQKRNGELCPDEFFKGKQLAFIRKQPSLLGTPDEKRFRFTRCGESGIEISNLLPHLQQVADEITFIRSMHTDQFNHAPAQMLMLTGFQRFGRPSIGSWASYGLGSENQNLPSFVVLITGQVLGAGNSAWGSGFLPTVHQGVEFRSKALMLGIGIPAYERWTFDPIVDAVAHLKRLNPKLIKFHHNNEWEGEYFTVDLTGSELCEGDLTYVRKINPMEIILSRSNVTDDNLWELSGAKAGRIVLSDTEVTDAGIEQLRRSIGTDCNIIK